MSVRLLNRLSFLMKRVRISRRAFRYLLLVAAIVGLISVAAGVSLAASSGKSSRVTDLAPHGSHRVVPQQASTIAGMRRVGASVAVPAGAKRLLSELSGAQVGVVDAAGTRVLLSEARSWGGTLYAAPSDSGRVCYLIQGGPESCVDSFTQIAPIAWTKFDRDGPGGDPVVVAGLVPDDVTALEVDTGGRSYPVDLLNNAFLAEVPNDATASALTIHYQDGTSIEQPLGLLHSEGR
jgi:hypothetical protein